jgi:hypothetical protein
MQFGTVNLWTDATKDLSDAELQAGFDGLVAHWTNEYKRVPTPGDLRKFINKASTINHGAMFDEIINNAHAATVGYFDRKTGQVEKYQFSPLVQAAIRQMGGIDQLNTFRSQFRDIVNALNEQEQNKAIVKPILDARQALGQAQPQARPMLQAANTEPETSEPDPRVVESFAALRARFEAKQKAMSEAKVVDMQSRLKALSETMGANQ